MEGLIVLLLFCILCTLCSIKRDTSKNNSRSNEGVVHISYESEKPEISDEERERIERANWKRDRSKLYLSDLDLSFLHKD